jgi:RNA polymerase sigma factor (sigma-70 family)
MKATAETVATVKTTVEKFARQYARTARGHLGYDDFVQIGYMAAMKAAESFDPSMGATLATYCRRPVSNAMRAACAEWRGSMLSLDAPVGGDENETTFADLHAGEGATAEEALEGAERDALVRSMVDKAVAEFESHQEMARLLVGRLMDGEMVEERFRSDVSLADIATKFDVSRQYVGIVEKKLKARLVELLKEAA